MLLEDSLQIQAIADARLCQDMSGMGRIRLKLAPERLDREPQVLHAINTARAPHGTEDLFMGENLAGTFSKNP